VNDPLTEDGPWVSDTVTNTYHTARMRTGLGLGQRGGRFRTNREPQKGGYCLDCDASAPLWLSPDTAKPGKDWFGPSQSTAEPAPCRCCAESGVPGIEV
jgi:hypothetical protein